MCVENISLRGKENTLFFAEVQQEKKKVCDGVYVCDGV